MPKLSRVPETVITDHAEKLFWLSAIWEAIAEGRLEYEIARLSTRGGRICIRQLDGTRLLVNISDFDGIPILVGPDYDVSAYLLEPRWGYSLPPGGQEFCFNCTRSWIFSNDRDISKRVHAMWAGLLSLLQSIKEAHSNREKLLQKNKVRESLGLGVLVEPIEEVNDRELIAAQSEVITAS